jgi:hypothetical protein
MMALIARHEAVISKLQIMITDVSHPSLETALQGSHRRVAGKKAHQQ